MLRKLYVMAPICTPSIREFGFGFVCANALKSDPLPPSTAAAGSPASASFANSRLVCDISTPRNLGNGLQLPTLAENRLHVLVGVPVVGELHLLRIPQQLALDARRGRAEHHPLGIRSGDAETGAGGLASLAGAHPVSLMAR